MHSHTERAQNQKSEGLQISCGLYLTKKTLETLLLEVGTSPRFCVSGGHGSLHEQVEWGNGVEHIYKWPVLHDLLIA